MKLPEAISYFERLLEHSTSKSDAKIFRAFLKVLANLHDRKWSDSDLDKIEAKLAGLEANGHSGNQKKYIRKKYAELTTFLQKEFSLITTGYYTTQGMIFGMIFGQGLGVAMGTAFGVETGIALGLSLGTGMGMGLGIAFGAMKDAEAKKQGKVLA